MPAKYLIRFDDLCPTMNWDAWTEIETILWESEIKPILAVVPDNQDKTLQIAPAVDQFWDRVRLWQSRGWTIGLHGYRHEYVSRDGGIVRRTNYSEFAGLSAQEQEQKLQLAVGVFKSEGIEPRVWVAPGHSFDEVTVAILKKVGIFCISDGYFLYPCRDSWAMVWVPQQLGKFRFMPFGVWTVCNHHNLWTVIDVAKLRRDVQRFRNSIVGFDSVVDAYKDRRSNWADMFFSRVWLIATSAKNRLARASSRYKLS